jgi:glycosyltransferase involved in cell wall biosynthesis
MNKAKVSVIVPCYNQAHYLAESVTSILKQEFQSWELIIVNDGSTDNTRSLAEQYAAADKRITVINKNNGGLSAARNTGAQVASGHYLLFLDADDFILPYAFEKIHAFSVRNEEPDIIQVGYQYVSERNEKVLRSVHPPERASMLPFTLVNNLGPCHSLFVKRAFTNKIGVFDESLKSAEDWDFWMRAAKAGAVLKTLSEILVSYRYVADSMSRDAFTMYEAVKTVLLRGCEKDQRITVASADNIKRTIDISAPIKTRLLTCLGVSVMQGKIKQSVELFRKEMNTFRLTFSAEDFKAMYSYLSFRYWSGEQEIDRILNEFVPRFKSFFLESGLSPAEQQKALEAVFLPVRKIRNVNQHGKIIGGLMNKFL